MNSPCKDCLTYALCKARYKSQVKIPNFPAAEALINLSCKCSNLLNNLVLQLGKEKKTRHVVINPLTKRKVIFLPMDYTSLHRIFISRIEKSSDGSIW